MPAAWRPRLRNFLFGLHSLTFTRPSGVRLRVADDSDWTVYTEVFRHGEYNVAINRALDSADAGHFNVVDLGANVGFFTLRLIDVIRTRGDRSLDVAITAIEGSPQRVADLRSRILGDNGLTAQVRVMAGLVGEPIRGRDDVRDAVSWRKQPVQASGFWASCAARVRGRFAIARLGVGHPPPQV